MTDIYPQFAAWLHSLSTIEVLLFVGGVVATAYVGSRGNKNSIFYD